MQTILFISRNDLIKRTPIGGNIDPEKIVPFIYTAQNKYIWPVLGTPLYERLQEDIKNSTLDGDYKTLVEQYITDTLAHYAVVEFLPFGIYNIVNSGIQQFTPDNTTAPDKVNIDYLLQKELSTAQFFAERLRQFLCANSTLYPEYNESTGNIDMIFPDKTKQYKGGWVL